MKTKICINCKIEKSFDQFNKGTDKFGLQNWCKNCQKQHYQDHKAEMKQYYQDHKAEIKQQMNQYRQDHKAEIKQYRLAHKPERKQQSKQYYLAHKAERNQYIKNRLTTDPIYKLLQNLRNLLGITLHNYNITKSHKIMEYHGCTMGVLVNHLFSNGVSLQDYLKGGYEIEHIIPRCLFELEKYPEDIYQAEHWSNLQILDKVTHLEKTARDMEILVELRG